MQNKFCCVNLIGRSWITNCITTKYLMGVDMKVSEDCIEERARGRSQTLHLLQDVVEQLQRI